MPEQPPRDRRKGTYEAGLPRLRPAFGVRPFGADTTCQHLHPGGDLPPYSVLYCVACHRTGAAVEKALRRRRQEAEALRKAEEDRLAREERTIMGVRRFGRRKSSKKVA